MTDSETIVNLIKYISAHSKEDNEGKIRIEPTVIHKIHTLVADHPETALAVVGLYCKLAKNDPTYFEFAWIIAGAYQDEFDDDVLMITVQNAQNKSFKSDQVLKSVG